MTHKGVWIWNVPAIESGDPVLITIRLIEAGITDVYIKAANGPYVFKQAKAGSYGAWGENLRKELVDTLHEAGIKVWGWGFCYGADPKNEGKIAGMQVERFNLNGWIFDEESQADEQEKADSNGVHTCLEYKKMTDKPAILCWWARVKDPVSGNQWHPDPAHGLTAKDIIRAWDPYVDAYMPMVYWGTDGKNDPEGMKAAVRLIEQCVAQYRELTEKAIIPTGRAYIGDGGVAFSAAMKLFADRAMELGCAGVTWWSMEHAIKLADIWETIAEIHAELAEYLTPSTVSGSGEQEEVIEVSTESAASIWKTVTDNHLNLRLAPGKIDGTERGGLMAGDEVEVLPGRTMQNGIAYVPVVMFVAEEYLK